MSTRFRSGVWYQVDGDNNGMTYGCTLACFDGDRIDVRKIQPTVEYVGEDEAVSAGVAFWTREASYDAGDIRKILNDRNPCGWAPLDFCGIDVPGDVKITRSIMATVACAALDHGHMTDEGPSGFSADVLPDRLARDGTTPTRADGHEADREYRRLVRHANR